MSALQELGTPGFPFVVSIDAQATAGTADEWTAFVAPYAGRITKVDWIPKAAVTANGTNYFTLNVRNRGANGSGTTLAATRAYSATNSTALKGESFTVSGTRANTVVAAGDTITVERLVTGTGLASPAGTVVIWLVAS